MFINYLNHICPIPLVSQDLLLSNYARPIKLLYSSMKLFLN